jgi:hypothetical protein
MTLRALPSAQATKLRLAVTGVDQASLTWRLLGSRVLLSTNLLDISVGLVKRLVDDD